MRFLIVLAGVALLGCSAGTTTTRTTTTTASTASTAAAASAPLLMDVSCNAEHESVCDEKGCRAETDGMVPLALSYNGATGHGDLCMGESCNGVYLTALPADTPDPTADLIAAIVATGAADEHHEARPPSSEGVALIAHDHASFQVFRGSDVWSGRCAQAVHDQ